MNAVFIQTVIGENSADVIKTLAHATRQQGGEWLSAKVSKLDGRFAALMKISIDPDKEAGLKDALKAEFPDLDFTFSPASETAAVQTTATNLTVDCTDRPGMTRDLNKLIAELGIEVEYIETHRFPVSLMGKTVYSAKLTVIMPEGMTAEQLEEEFKVICEEVRVTFD